MSADIFVTNSDQERLTKLMEKHLKETRVVNASVKKLKGELNRATVVASEAVPADVITMNSKALLEMDDEDIEVSLVYPDDADIASTKLSIFSPIGTAILGYREGSVVEWEVPSGTSKILIKKVIYQPEAAGDFDL